MPQTINRSTQSTHPIKAFLPKAVRKAIVAAGPYPNGRNAANKCPLDVAVEVMLPGVSSRGTDAPVFARRHASAFGTDRGAVKSAADSFIRCVDSGRNPDGTPFSLHTALKIAVPQYDEWGRRVNPS